jgi:hypothetical protein
MQAQQPKRVTMEKNLWKKLKKNDYIMISAAKKTGR